MKKIILGSDHAGFSLKEFIKSSLANEYECIDVGTHSAISCDYPTFAKALSREVLDKNTVGILICGTGIGVSITANRFAGIRAALCTNELMAKMAKRHNNANILCLGSRIIGKDLAVSIAKVFLESEFDSGRHAHRVTMIDN